MPEWFPLLVVISFLLSAIVWFGIYVYASFATHRSAQERRRILVLAVLPFWLPIVLSVVQAVAAKQQHIAEMVLFEVLLWMLFSALFIGSNSIYYTRSEQRLARLVTRNPGLLDKPILGAVLRHRLRYWNKDQNREEGRGRQP